MKKQKKCIQLGKNHENGQVPLTLEGVTSVPKLRTDLNGVNNDRSNAKKCGNVAWAVIYDTLLGPYEYWRKIANSHAILI